MISPHIDASEVQTFLSFWLEVRRNQSRIYPDINWLSISAVLQNAEIAGRSPVDTASIAAESGIPKATVRHCLKHMADRGYVTRLKTGWVAEESAWLALELALPGFKQAMAGLSNSVTELHLTTPSME